MILINISAAQQGRCRPEGTALHLNLKKEDSVAEFRRRNIRLAPEDYCGRKMYFVTLCFDGRRRFGANPRLASWLVGQIQKISAASQFWVHAYCVMPDHFHALVDGASDQSNLMTFVESFKQETAFEFRRRMHCRLWQFKYYDHILRRRDAPERVAWYIWMNPVRKGICLAPLDYPFLGSFTQVGTRMLNGSMAGEWTPPWKPKGVNVAPSLQGGMGKQNAK